MHPNDVSLMKFKGHLTLVTLIRCGLSPALTGSRYLYAGERASGVPCLPELWRRGR